MLNLGKILILIIAVMLSFAPAINGQFIWDDNFNISENRALKTIGGLSDIWLSPTSTLQFYPLY